MAGKNDFEAVSTFGDGNYEALPKSVLALIAYHLAQRIAGSEDRDAVLAEIAGEWRALHANGIVAQKPRHLETREEEAQRIERYPATGRSDAFGRSNRERVAALRTAP